jgi:hypothetical protein
VRICEKIRSCHVSTSHNHRGVLVSVGVIIAGDSRLVVSCFQHPVLGCVHREEPPDVTVIFMERAMRVLILAGVVLSLE